MLLHASGLPVGGFARIKLGKGSHPVIPYCRQEGAPDDTMLPLESPVKFHYSRRQLGCGAFLSLIPLSLPLPAAAGGTPASAFSPVGVGGTLGSFIPPFPPQPVSLPRRRLGPAFAILLLASGYDTADYLDYIAMDAFQRDFWLLRHGEWEPYTLQYSPLRITQVNRRVNDFRLLLEMPLLDEACVLITLCSNYFLSIFQGDLSDPQYFDFISAMQMSTITTSMRNGLQTFKEYCGEECPPGTEGDYKLVTRDPSLQDNQLLPTTFELNLGNTIYTSLREGFRGVQFNAPPPVAANSSVDELIGGIKALLLQVFVDQGYCINADVTNVRPGSVPGSVQFSVKLDGPCTLWALQSVASKRGNLFPIYDAVTIAAYLRASGRSGTCSFAWSSTAVTEEWTITQI